jgi:hypothetical protein
MHVGFERAMGILRQAPSLVSRGQPAGRSIGNVATCEQRIVRRPERDASRCPAAFIGGASPPRRCGAHCVASAVGDLRNAKIADQTPRHRGILSDDGFKSPSCGPDGLEPRIGASIT